MNENAHPNPEQSVDEVEQAAEGESEPSGQLGFPVVGVGASAGGLEAMEQFLQHLPADAGVAVIFVQHLSPKHVSSLTSILPRSTSMSVCEASDGMRIERDHLYVIPPDRDLAVLHGALHLMARPKAHARHMPVDYLFRSLAQDQGSHSIGVVLSGTGSDGSEGLRAIKAEGGVTFAQDQESAKYAGMPHAAVATGQVDFVLSPPEIARELGRIIRHPHVCRPAVASEESPLGAPEALQKIFVLLRQAKEVDFSQYKQSTVERRIARRMVLNRVDSAQQYLKLLQQTPREVHALFDDMLISVTSFFREPAAFEALKEKVFPEITREKGPNAPVRIWVPGCSTGEEPYSIAIALLEYLAERDVHLPIQVFATDISEKSIETARRGQYSENIAGDMSGERLRRYFVPSGNGYQVGKVVRDVCVFARQNVAKDPPFSNIDLISCRNLLIYLGRALQQRVLPTFHYALRPPGFLLLGQSETIGGFADLFSLVDREHKIYGRKGTASRLPFELGPPSPAAQPQPEEKPRAARPSAHDGLERQADRLLLEQYAPPGVIIDADMQILHFRGQTGRFLEPLPGAASLNLLRMARPGLALDLQSLVYQARKSQAPARKEGLCVQGDGGAVAVNLRVCPLGHVEDARFLVLFEEPPSPAQNEDKAPHTRAEKGNEKDAGSETEESEADRLRRELQQTKATMQSMLEDHETTNEELRAANEEIQSANEELQSTNEELETAKEELQSTNEELSTLNAELENQNAEANRAIDDFNNLHRAVDIPVILLDKELRIRTFTPPAERQLGLQSTDRGRSIGQLKLGLRVDGLESRIREVLQSLNTFCDEVRTEQDRWYSLQIRPFRTRDDRITGAVLTLIDITDIRRAEQANYARVLAEGIVNGIRQPLLVLDDRLRVVTANRAFYRTFRTSAGKTEGCLVYELGEGQWNHADLKHLLEDIIPEDREFEGFEIVHEFPGLGRKRAVLDARRIEPGGDQPNLILLTVRELTDA